MAVNWEALFQSAGIECRTGGNNVAAGNININCPFCRDDPSFHLGINLQSGAYGCWRNSEHKGRNPFRVLSYLIGAKRAKELLLIHSTPNDKPVRENIAPQKDRPAYVALDEPIRRIDETDESARSFIDYVNARGISLDTAKDFHLHYALYGEYARRVIIPAISYDGEVMAFTARTIATDESVVRYKALTNEKCVKPPKEIVYGEHLLSRDVVSLVLCEGVFDAMRLYELLPRHLSPLAAGTNNITKAQASRITKLFNMYNCEDVRVVLDNGAFGNALKIANNLSHISARAVRLPDGVSDPAELDNADFLALA